MQIAAAASGALIIAIAVASPLLWRHQAPPPSQAPVPDVAQQISTPPPPPPAPTMTADAPAARQPKATPPPLPTTTEIGRPLSRPQVVQLQNQLKALGFNPGPADGMVGPRTVAAARAFQAANGQAATGLVDTRLLDAVTAAGAGADTAPDGR
jgi:peptidoglycan hydrolase-like protein with peptidoglycan-binding domain